jgi:hypothetical protein
MSRTGLIVVLVAVLGNAGCNRCDAPEKITYGADCTPVPAGTIGCEGGPSFGAPNGRVPDPDKTFPVGCSVQLPFCVGAYPDSVQGCTCQRSRPDSKPTWVCPV